MEEGSKSAEQGLNGGFGVNRQREGLDAVGRKGGEGGRGARGGKDAEVASMKCESEGVANAPGRAAECGVSVNVHHGRLSH